MKKIFLCFIYSLTICLSSFAQEYQNLATQEMQRKQNYFLDSLVGKSIPDIEFTTIKGQKMKLSELRGRSIFINFFFLGCQPCRRELPELSRIAEDYSQNNKKVIFISVSIAIADSIQKVTEYVSKQKYSNYMNFVPFAKQKLNIYNENNTHIVSDTKALAKSIFFIPSYPANIIIDSKGKIAFCKLGYAVREYDGQIPPEGLNEKILRQALDRVLVAD